jgi:hypothetical protein
MTAHDGASTTDTRSISTVSYGTPTKYDGSCQRLLAGAMAAEQTPSKHDDRYGRRSVIMVPV